VRGDDHVCRGQMSRDDDDEHENVVKDLGVWIDPALSYDDHICEKINIANKMLGVIRRNFVDLDVHSFCLIYKALVRSHLEYASSVWNPYRKGQISDIESVQRKATKLIRGCRTLPYKERLAFLQLPTLKYRRYRGDMIEVFKIINGLYDSKVVPTIIRNFDSRTRGNSFKLMVVRCKYDVSKYGFCNRVVNLWNSLSNTIVSSSSVNVFKNNLDKFWRNQNFYYDYEDEPLGFHCT